jgi:hypothetical protein
MQGPRLVGGANRIAVLTYELWDVESGNLVGAYATERAALDAVLESIELYGPTSVESLSLGYESADGRSTLLARGPALAARARPTAAQRRRRGPSEPRDDSVPATKRVEAGIQPSGPRTRRSTSKK